MSSSDSAPATRKPHPGVRFKYDLVTTSTMTLAIHIAFIIAFPAFVLGFAGAYTDKYMGGGFTFLGLGLVLAMIFSGYWVVHRVRTFVNNHPVDPPKKY